MITANSIPPQQGCHLSGCFQGWVKVHICIESFATEINLKESCGKVLQY